MKKFIFYFRFLFALAIVAPAPVVVTVAQRVPLNSKGKTNIGLYKLEGQSNACGNVPITRLPAKYLNPSVNARHWNLQTLAWEQQQLGFNAWGTPSDWQSQYPTRVFGIEAELMRLLVNWYKAPQYMHKWTWPGSSIDSWNPTGTNNYFTRAKASFLQSLQALPPGTKLKATIWIQGESNLYDTEYVTKLTNLIAAERAYTGIQHPYIIVSVSTGQTFLNAQALLNFQTVQRSMAQYVLELDGVTLTTQTGPNVIPNVYFIHQNEQCQTETKGMYDPNGTEVIHYDAVGLENIAKKIFILIKRFY